MRVGAKMNKGHRLWALGLAALIWGGSAAAQPALIGVLPRTPGGTDYQAYYDPAANLTWLADANANGPMTWSQAKAWAAHLDINGVTGWRLPNSAQPDPACSMQIAGLSRGYGCTGSEMGNLFYNVLGNPNLSNLCGKSGDCARVATTLKNRGPFSNIQSNYYWTATEDPTDSDSVLYFDFRYGDQREVNKVFGMYAWAVHSGNVGRATASDAGGRAARPAGAQHGAGHPQ